MFKAGQKVVYVGNKTLKHGEIYTVTETAICPCCGQQSVSINNEKTMHPGPLLCICGSDGEYSAYHHWMSYVFRPLNYQFGEDVAASIEEIINEEFLIEVL